MSQKIQVMIVEDDKDFTYLLKATLEKQTDIAVTAACTTAAAAIELAKQYRPDIVLMDLNLSASNMLSLIHILPLIKHQKFNLL